MRKSFFIIVIAVILISIIGGAAFQMSVAPSEEIRSYLNEFLWNIKNGSHNKNIFHNALKEWYLTLAALIACGFFKPGFIPTLLVTARKCFVTAFSASAFMHYYRFQGFLSAAALTLPFMLSLTTLVFMCCASISLSLNPDKLSHSAIRPYIAFSIAAAVTFFASALAEGYLVPPLILFIMK